jgi:hypothetical protein
MNNIVRLVCSVLALVLLVACGGAPATSDDSDNTQPARAATQPPMNVAPCAPHTKLYGVE